MTRPVLVAFGLGLLSALGLSCLGPLPLDDYSYACSGDGDCQAGHFCIQGTCKVPGACATSADCGASNCCDDFSGTNQCVLAGKGCTFGTCSASTRTCE